MAPKPVDKAGSLTGRTLHGRALALPSAVAKVSARLIRSFNSSQVCCPAHCVTARQSIGYGRCVRQEPAFARSPSRPVRQFASCEGSRGLLTGQERRGDRRKWLDISTASVSRGRKRSGGGSNKPSCGTTFRRVLKRIQGSGGTSHLIGRPSSSLPAHCRSRLGGARGVLVRRREAGHTGRRGSAHQI
jgi:hypothetical protein